MCMDALHAYIHTYNVPCACLVPVEARGMSGFPETRIQDGNDLFVWVIGIKPRMEEQPNASNHLTISSLWGSCLLCWGEGVVSFLVCMRLGLIM